MHWQEMQHRLRARPFQPFRIRLADNRVYEVYNPEFTLVTREEFLVGVPARIDPDDFPDRMIHVDWSQLTGLELLNASPTHATG
jgi:hypothetical protein